MAPGLKTRLQLRGRVFITGNIEAKSGLRIGGTGGAFSIGGVDNPVIVNQVTGEPYIPGSSLRGKMRSLTEKYQGKITGQRISGIEIHACHNEPDYTACSICNVFGITAQNFNLPTRLIVRDVPLTLASAQKLRAAKTTLPYTEVKVEVAIDRVTSQATPRDIERVPAGAVFGPMELIYNIYEERDLDWLTVLLEAMELLQDDYLGGLGSRGSGKIAFTGLDIALKLSGSYRTRIPIRTVEALDALDSAQLLKDIKPFFYQNPEH